MAVSKDGPQYRFVIPGTRRETVRLVTYRSTIEAAARLGAVVDDLVVDVEEAGHHAGVSLPSSMLDFIDLGPPALAALKKILNESRDSWPVGAALPLANVRLLAPIPRPRKNIFGIGLNYVEHVAESSRALDTAKDLPKQPDIRQRQGRADGPAILAFVQYLLEGRQRGRPEIDEVEHR